MRKLSFFVIVVILGISLLLIILRYNDKNNISAEDILAEQILHTFLEENGMEIKPGTTEYRRFLKWVALGEYPELTGTDSKFIHTQEERDAVFRYATRNMDQGIWKKFFVKEPNEKKAVP